MFGAVVPDKGSASDRRSGTQRRSLINKRHVAPAFAGATGFSGNVVPDKGAPATADLEPSVVLVSTNDTGLPLSRERRDVRSRRSGQGSVSDRRSGTQCRWLIDEHPGL